MNELCWRLSPEPDLPPTFYKSFRRAVATLKERGQIDTYGRKLVNIDQVIRFYPSRARAVRVKQLRERLLPIAKQYLIRTGKRQFRREDTEGYILSKFPPIPELRKTWRNVERQLLQHAATRVTDEEEIRSLIALLSKGRAVFVPRSRAVSGSLWEAIEEFKVTALGRTETAICDDLRQLYRDCFHQELRTASLKERLYVLVNFDMRGTHFLKEEIKEELLLRDPEYVRSLEGHQVRDKPRGFVRAQEQFSPLLDDLLRRDVLSPFVFIRAPH